jgi:hypothetical protein
MISELDLPPIALAVRQPWAWAIIHGGKDIENRTIDAVAKGGMEPRRIAILASKGMTREEYESAAWFMRDEIGIECPAAAQLLRGGIIGAVTVTGIVSESESPWFFKQRRGRGLVLSEPQACSFVPAFGELGYFKWERDGDRGPCEPALWMKRGLSSNPPAAAEPEADLFR